MSPRFENPGGAALVVFSGGQDSTTCLYWAQARFERVEALCFDYAQRHVCEIDAARRIATLASVSLTILPISSLPALGGNSLTDSSVEVEDQASEGALPNSFVPGRNLLFLTLAAAAAYQRGIADLVTGVCQTDYSGYPDCRAATIQSLEETLALGMDSRFRIHTPLMELSKAESVALASSLPGCMDALAYSHTCYRGQRPPCGRCPACRLRALGFAEAGHDDPLVKGFAVPD